MQRGIIPTVHHIDSCPPHDQHFDHSRSAFSAGPVQGGEAMIVPLRKAQGSLIWKWDVGKGFGTEKLNIHSAYSPWEALPLELDSHSCQQFPKLSSPDLPLSFKPSQPLPEIPTNPYDSLSSSPSSLSSLAHSISLNGNILHLVSAPFGNIHWFFLFTPHLVHCLTTYSTCHTGL